MSTELGEDRVRDIGSGATAVHAAATAATALAPPAGGTGATAGGYDSAANRNLAIASLTAQIADMAVIRAQLQAMGIAAGSTTLAGRSRVRAISSGIIPPSGVSATATALAPPAGGTGANAGGYDTAANRN